MNLDSFISVFGNGWRKIMNVSNGSAILSAKVYHSHSNYLWEQTCENVGFDEDWFVLNMDGFRSEESSQTFGVLVHTGEKESEPPIPPTSRRFLSSWLLDSPSAQAGPKCINGFSLGRWCNDREFAQPVLHSGTLPVHLMKNSLVHAGPEGLKWKGGYFSSTWQYGNQRWDWILQAKYIVAWFIRAAFASDRFTKETCSSGENWEIFLGELVQVRLMGTTRSPRKSSWILPHPCMYIWCSSECSLKLLKEYLKKCKQDARKSREFTHNLMLISGTQFTLSKLWCMSSLEAPWKCRRGRYSQLTCIKEFTRSKRVLSPRIYP